MKIRSITMPSIRWAFNATNWQPRKCEWILANQCVQLEEKKRIASFVFKRDAKLSMVGRLMLRRAIHRLTNIPYGDIQLSRTDKGKPYLLNHLPATCRHLSFNVSHQGDYVVLAAETDGKVGIDVMNSETPRMKTIPEFFHTMRRQFTTEEWETIRSDISEREQLKTFYRLWVLCLKESYVKALGIGIGFEVKRLNFNLHTPTLEEAKMISSTTLRVDGREATEWQFQETSVDNHCVAVALHNPSNMLDEAASSSFIVLRTAELLEDCKPLTDPDEDCGNKFMDKHVDPSSMRSRNDPS